MYIELPVKMVEEPTPEERKEYREELKIMMLNASEDDPDIDEDSFFESKLRYFYNKVVFSLDQLIPFSKYDKDHCIINYADMNLMAKVKYEDLKAIFESVGSLKIRTLDEFKIERPKTK